MQLEVCWRWIQESVLDKLEGMNEEAWYAYLVYFFTEKATAPNHTPIDYDAWKRSASGDEQEVDDATRHLADAVASATSSALEESNVPIRPVDCSSTLPPASSSTTDEGESDDWCRICFEDPICTAVVDCGHQVMCERCAFSLNLSECPICRVPITKIIKLYRT